VPQVTFAAETQLDELAAKLGIDRLELRRRNMLHPGDPWFGGQAIRSNGLAECVALVYGNNQRSAATRYGGPSAMGGERFQAYVYYAPWGLTSQGALYAMMANRYMAETGFSAADLGAVAVAERAWANRNPAAQFHDSTLTLDDYHRSRWIVEPFHLLDCCLVSNGGAAVIVTSAERARDLRQPPVYLWGFGQGHPGGDPVDTLTSGAPLAKRTAFVMAGIDTADVDVAELYDCYTFTVLVTLEDYGFCPKGESGRFVRDGNIAPGGRLPVNTGGGQLSSFYMWGMTPVAEAVIQARGQGGARQAAEHDVVLVSGNGGILSTHSTLVMSPLAS